MNAVDAVADERLLVAHEIYRIGKLAISFGYCLIVRPDSSH